MAVEKILELIDGYRDDIIQLQKELTKRVALGPDNGGSGEHDKAKYLKEKLEELEPDELEEIRAPDERVAQGYRPNLVAKWQGKRPHPTVWVLSHMDVVPPGDLSLWNT
ncbi:MAG: M20 family metallo-hydrolase, partial [Deltaproteobacteria bacterium]|nr:M20 family metallo-hydrolase [Deltaproteobacteria bacterium]